jgi:hypothetical protein
MKVLLVGGGGREHALAWKLSKSKRLEHLYIAPEIQVQRITGRTWILRTRMFPVLWRLPSLRRLIWR